jgi:hypothetical protein
MVIFRGFIHWRVIAVIFVLGHCPYCIARGSRAGALIEDPGHFALIRLPNSKVPADAIVHGSMSCVMQSVLDSKARNEALDLLARADMPAEQEREREQREQEIVSDGIHAIADGIAKLSRRLDALVQSRDARRKLGEERERADSLTSNVFGLIKRMLPTRQPQPQQKPYAFRAFLKSSDW